jgi:hypothetical protein
MAQKVTIVPANNYIAESFYNASSEYFQSRGLQLVAASIRVRVNKEVCHTKDSDLTFDLPEDAFLKQPKSLTQNVTKTEQYNITKSLPNLDPIGGIEKVQNAYRTQFPTWDFYFKNVTILGAPWGPDRLRERQIWIRQEGLSKEERKAEGIPFKEQPYILRLLSINGKHFEEMSETERWARIGGKPGSGTTFADDHCKLIYLKKKGKKSGQSADNFATYCANLTNR